MNYWQILLQKKKGRYSLVSHIDKNPLLVLINKLINMPVLLDRKEHRMRERPSPSYVGKNVTGRIVYTSNPLSMGGCVALAELSSDKLKSV
jgi:hypothetical protein